jgi:3-hydroxyisobutyrate dehydrogenase-like beta-hydroxyacid dehydrogenase
MKVGFVGLGSMGSEMARNLIKSGHELTVYNRTRSRAEPFAALGARIAAAPAEAAQNSEAVLTMLADDAATEAVVFGSNGILASMPQTSVHATTSTISVALSRKLATAHRERGQQYMGAPVFGRPEAAAQAKLFIVAAGSAEQIKKCQPLFDAMGQKTFTAGEDPVGAHVVKLAGNFLISTVIESLAEASALVKKSGVDPNQFLEIMTNSLFTAPVYKIYGAMVASQKFEPVGFKLPLGFKDNRLVLAAAEQAAVPMPMASLIRDRLISAIAQGLSEADWSAIARLPFREAGL